MGVGIYYYLWKLAASAYTSVESSKSVTKGIQSEFRSSYSDPSWSSTFHFFTILQTTLKHTQALSKSSHCCPWSPSQILCFLKQNKKNLHYWRKIFRFHISKNLIMKNLSYQCLLKNCSWDKYSFTFKN